MTTIAGTDRSEECYYRVSRALLEEARRLIVIGIFTRMRYTRLRDCHIVRQYESAAGERALLHLVANKFGLKVTNAGGGNGATVHVADWGPGAYRPTVSMTLRIRYIVVDGVSATAAALYNSKRCAWCQWRTRIPETIQKALAFHFRIAFASTSAGRSTNLGPGRGLVLA